MNEHEIRNELRRLGERLERVEKRLELGHIPAAPAESPLELPPIVPRPMTEPVVDSRSVEASRTPPPPSTLRPPTAPAVAARSEEAPPEKPLIDSKAETVTAAPLSPREPLRSPAVSIEDSSLDAEHSARTPFAFLPRRKTPPAGPRQPLELRIGMRWMAWIGAIVVVVAMGFFVKLAYDSGWLVMPAYVKCLLSFAFGALLLVGGEVTLRKIGRTSSVGLFGAGLGTLYLTSFATSKTFNLLSEAGSLWLMMAVAVLGIAISVRGRMLTIGVLAIVGGYLSPVLLPAKTSFAAAFPLYLSMLLGVALALSGLMPRPFRALRYVALGGHALLGSAWVLAEGTRNLPLTMTFISLWWAMVAVEALYAALRRQSSTGNAVASLLATFWFVTMGAWILAEAPGVSHKWLCLQMLLVAALSGLAAAVFEPSLAALRRRPTIAIEKLALTFWLQTGVLVAVSIAVLFDDFGQTIGWLAMGLACVEAGRQLRSRGVSRFGLIVGAFALLRIVTLDRMLASLQSEIFSATNIVVMTQWSILALAGIAALHAAARRYPHAEGKHRLTPVSLATLGTVGWMALCWHDCRELATTAGWLTGAVALIATARYGRRQRYFESGMLVLAVAALKWMFLDAGVGRFQRGWSPDDAWPLLNPQMLIGLVLAGAAMVIFMLNRPRSTADDQSDDSKDTPLPAEFVAWLPVAACVLAFWGLSFEVDRTIGLWEMRQAAGWVSAWPREQLRGLWITLLWAVGGLFMLLCGKRFCQDKLFAAGWATVVLTACSWLTFGTLAWRVSRGVAWQASPLFNVQCGVGIAIGGLLIAARFATRRIARPVPVGDVNTQQAVSLAPALCALLILWVGSLEIDRLLAPEANSMQMAAMARQTALSVFWGVYAIGLIAVGFMRRMRAARYCGLALLAITLGKVLVVDLSEIGTIYRVLSLLVVGLLFVGTSIAYAKLASRLLDAAAGGQREATTE